MKSRLRMLERRQMDGAQRDIHDAIVASRGNVDGPFLAWLHAPGLADPAQRLGAYCRYGTSLDLMESELLILLVAAQHRCIGEQQIHEPIALKAGLHAAAIEAIGDGDVPVLEGARQEMLWKVATTLLRTHRIPSDLYAEADDLLGSTTMVETVGILGYYAMVAMTLNAFEMRKD